MVIIKKYENRRLYDTTNSRYVNLDEVAQMVKEGFDVQVMDAATGEDLTRLVLTQIIVEHAKEPNSAFPLDVLRQMVVASGKVTQESTLKYMKAVFDMYQNAFRAMSPAVTPFDFFTRARSGASAGTTVSADIPPTYSSAPDKPADVDELKRRIEELETMVSRLGAPRALGKRSSKSRKRH
ncbi:MAG TPA: polyhydroxyalkanoate synthesis regulator DNA-binding domain-containing protein [Terriglobales bacterium]|nr:polyhydroxyalkanoate synthesis regulator DNA-binding domain-containing protein [Terriglobales bacterium]